MRNFLKRSIPAAAVMFTLFIGVAMPLRADERAECQKRIEKTEAKLEKAVHKHGERSRQAENQRRALNEERERCWNRYHSWYNGRDHQWHNEHDWDRR